MASTAAINLVKKALQYGNLNNLQNQQFWSETPLATKNEAYSLLTSSMQSPQALASLLKQTGVTNYQNSQWWTSLPLATRQQAYSIATGQPVTSTTTTAPKPATTTTTTSGAETPIKNQTTQQIQAGVAAVNNAVNTPTYSAPTTSTTPTSSSSTSTGGNGFTLKQNEYGGWSISSPDGKVISNYDSGSLGMAQNALGYWNKATPEQLAASGIQWRAPAASNSSTGYSTFNPGQISVTSDGVKHTWDIGYATNGGNYAVVKNNATGEMFNVSIPTGMTAYDFVNKYANEVIRPANTGNQDAIAKLSGGLNTAKSGSGSATNTGGYTVKQYTSPTGGVDGKPVELYDIYDSSGKLVTRTGSLASAQSWFSQKGLTMPGTGGASGAADDLVKKALLTNHTTDLNSLDWWNAAPIADRQAAYAKLTDLFSSPNKLASYVQQNGIQNLQNYSWWNSYGQKDQAWNLIQNLNAAGGAPGTSGSGSPAGTGAAPGTASNVPGGPAGPTPEQIKAQKQQTALSIIEASNLDAGTKALFRTAVDNWQPGDEVNVENIVKSFNEIKNSTIDPHFAELAKQTIDSLKTAAEYNRTQRQMEEQMNKTTADTNLRNTRSNLESSGLTFSGEANRQLGQESAFGGPGLMNTFAQGEGIVPQANRLMTTSTSAKYQNQLQNLARTAESSLGSAAMQGLVPEVGVLGGITGSYQDTKSGVYAQTATQLYNQAAQNVQYNKPINPISTS